MNTTTRLKAWGEKVTEAQYEQASAVSRLKSITADLENARQTLATAEEAQALIQEAAQAVQREAHARIASVVTRCLRVVFDREYEFRVDFEQKRGKTEAKLVFNLDGHDVVPTFGSFGVLDVAALALRVAALLLTRPPVRRLLLLDEPFSHVAAVNRPKVATLLEELAAELGIQMVLVSHDQEFQVGNVVQI